MAYEGVDGQTDKGMDCSIIICSRDRARSLEKTIKAFSKVAVPIGMQVEMIVVDNGSEDDTADVIKAAIHPWMEIRLVQESRPGKSRALNTGLRQAQADVLLFTDDDVEPAADWLVVMSTPLLEGRCDAVAGRILLGAELRRPWLTPLHELWLAVEAEPKGDAPILIGACMGVHRSVFDRIGPFDEELGPGGTGFGEETLLWNQMKEAGLRILPVADSFVIHHPEISRLQRGSWLAAAGRFGRTGAYVMHHWEHARISFPALRLLFLSGKLALRRCIRRKQVLDSEGCPAWEMSYTVRLETLRQFVSESRRPRNYDFHGLRKKEHDTSSASVIDLATMAIVAEKKE